MDITTSGFVLRATDIGDTNRILTLLTTDYGKMSVLAKGVRKASSKNSYGTQVFSYSDFEILSGNSGNILKTASIKNSFFDVSADIVRYSLAAYFSEVCDIVCQENTDESELLRLVLNCFYALVKLSDIPLFKIKAAFEMKTSEILGYRPDFDGCFECGKEREECGDEAGKINFSLHEGSFLCPECLSAHEKASFFTLSEGSVRSLETLLSLSQSKMLNFTVNTDDESEFSAFCENYLSAQTQARFKTLAFYKSTILQR